jgi:hypothetical protein
MSVGERYSSASVVGSCTTTRNEAALSSLSRKATVTGLFGSSFTVPVAVELRVDRHADRAHLLAGRHQQRPHLVMPVAPSNICFSPNEASR